MFVECLSWVDDNTLGEFWRRAYVDELSLLQGSDAGVDGVRFEVFFGAGTAVASWIRKFWECHARPFEEQSSQFLFGEIDFLCWILVWVILFGLVWR